MQLSLFDAEEPSIDKDKVTLELFQAYYDARKNKRNTINQLVFEKHLESNVLALADEITEYRYKPKPSICFIIDKPIKREIFAADFSDRVVHHFIYNHIYPIFDTTFINDSYSCRKGKGTHYGIRRVEEFVRSCSNNYTKDCYILKLDIKGYFMAINKSLLYEKTKTTLLAYQAKLKCDMDLMLYLIQQTIFNDPRKDCKIKGKRSDWNDLPASKSLFKAKPDCGLPIGNLTSQLFGNIYMDELDQYVKTELGFEYYGRYVDDFLIVHHDRDYLKSLIPHLSHFLLLNLKLTLHPEKIYLQHYSKGVKYLGAVIKPHRTYIANRTKGNFYDAMEKYNTLIDEKEPTAEDLAHFRSSINSYLGTMKHNRSYNIRKRLIFEKMNKRWWHYFYFNGGLNKCILKTHTPFS